MNKCRICEKDYEWGKHANEAEKNSGFCPDCWEQSFPISYVCRADLQDYLSPEEIAKFGDSEMADLANKMGEAYTLSGYWGALCDIARDIAAKNK